jgi:serine/threonine-protein kinase
MTERATPRPEATLERDPERRLSLLWRQGQRPDVQQFLAAAGDLSLEQVAAVLAVDQRERWQAGESIRAEVYLQRYPAIAADVERALELVYGEFLLREERGEEPAPDEFLRRFPAYVARLRQQFELHQALARESALGLGSTKIVGESATPATTASPARTLLTAYEILGELGRGGMGVVYKARQVALNRLVALKMLLHGALAGPGELTRFRREAEAVALLRHPNIVPIYDVGEHDGRPFFAMELVEGDRLDRVLAGTPQPPRAAAQLLATLARAIDHAHRQGIVHRDLKPANILFAACGVALATPQADLLVPKITDFGLAKRLDVQSGNTTPDGALLGTPGYMAPEQAAGNMRAVGPAADVYALGAILYEALTGRPPFLCATLADTLHQLRTEEPLPPRRRQSKVPRDLETICLKCLHKDPAKRYASADALADDLQRFLDGKPIQARPTGMIERSAKWARRRPAAAALLAVSVAALLLLSGGGWWSAAALRRSAEEEARQRRRAEESFHQAMAAVDQMLTEVGAVDLVDVPQMAPVRERLLRKALAFLSDFLAKRGDDPAVRFEAARAHGRCGDILSLQGLSVEAEQHYTGALELLAQVSPGPDQRREEGRTRDHLAALLKSSHRFPEAEDAYRRALELRQGLADEFANVPEHREELAGSRYLLGALLAPQAGRQDEAGDCYREALNVQQALAAASPDRLDYQRDVGRTLNNLAMLQRDIGDPDTARKTLTQAEAVQRQLIAKAADVPHHRRELARTLLNRGSLEKDPQRSREAFEQARDLLAGLVRDYSTVPDYRHELAGADYYLGRLLRKTKQLVVAESSLRTAVDLLSEKVPGEPKYQHQLGLVYGELGRVREEAGRGREAEIDYRRSVALLGELAAKHPLVHEYHSDLGNALENLAWLLVHRAALEETGPVVELFAAGATQNFCDLIGQQLRGRAALEEAATVLARAIAEQETALRPVPSARYKGYLRYHEALLAETRLRLGDLTGAAAAAEQLPLIAPARAEDFTRAAEFLARCAGMAAIRRESEEPYATRAVALLNQALKRLEGRPEQIKRLLDGLKHLPQYEPLRKRADFRKLLQDAEGQAQVGVG